MKKLKSEEKTWKVKLNVSKQFQFWV